MARAHDDLTAARRAATFARVVSLVAFGAVARPSHAQPQPEREGTRVQPEVRADFIDARAPAAHLGLGIVVPAGTYVRLGVVGAAGQVWRDGEGHASGRVDGVIRFVADPLREFRWAPYASGGVGAMYDDSARWRPVIVGVLGVEGPAAGGVVPAVEVGFGGGTRYGLVLRRAMRARR